MTVLLLKLTTKIFNTVKKITIILLMLGIQFVAGQSNNSRSKLAEISGVDKASADSLLNALQSRSMDRVRVTMNELVKQNRTYLVSIALTDASDEVKIEAAKALSSVNKKGVAMALLNASKELELAVRGGTEAEALRERAKLVFESSLASATSVKVKRDWSLEQRNKAFKDAIETLPE